MANIANDSTFLDGKKVESEEGAQQKVDNATVVSATQPTDANVWYKVLN